jgi:hypothetical protein
VAGGDPADRLAHEHLPVGGGERRRVRHRDLLLARALLRVVLLHRDRLLLQNAHEVIGEVLRGGQPDGGEAERPVQRAVPFLVPQRQRELVLERRLEHRAPLVGQTGGHAGEERSRADRPGLADQRVHGGEHGAGAGRVGEHDEGRRIGHQPHLAHRSQALHAHQLVERVHRGHADGEADAGLQPALQAVQPARLRADRAVVPAVEEAHEAKALLARPPQHLARRAAHRRLISLRGTGRP